MRTRAKRGTYKAKCDDCQEFFYASMLVEMWDGKYVCKVNGCYENRHPSDFYRITPDDQSVPWSRPEGTTVYSDAICAANGRSAISGLGTAGCAVSELIITV